MLADDSMQLETDTEKIFDDEDDKMFFQGFTAKDVIYVTENISKLPME